ncbi:hypothetical protein NZA98_16625, partial [Escherichia coli]|nr:hypothetical protein [Escherichia coli]
WIAIEIVILIVVAAISLTNLRNDFAEDRSRLAIELTNQYSQRRASVTLLELVLQLPDGDTEPSYIQVATGIVKAYAFLDRIQLYEMRPGQSELTEWITVPSATVKPGEADLPAIMRAVALQPEGETVAYAMPHLAEHVLFATKAMNGRTPAAIVVIYDVAKAIQSIALPEAI